MHEKNMLDDYGDITERYTMLDDMSRVYRKADGYGIIMAYIRWVVASLLACIFFDTNMNPKGEFVIRQRLTALFRYQYPNFFHEIFSGLLLLPSIG